MIKVGIVGGTGYTGSELLRLLVAHPEVALSAITSRAEAGRRVDDLFPNLRGHVDLSFVDPGDADLTGCDVVFFATPNGLAMKQTPQLLEAGVRVIDLAADFRIKDIATWEQWYGMSHSCAELVEEAVYGLPEVNREAIRGARLIANPGCYPTAATLGFLPLVEAGLVDTDHLIADCKSGASGAGRGAAVGTLLSETGESFCAYKADGHRHQPEIRQNLEVASNASIDLVFVPHLLPMIRGIHATLYARPKAPIEDLQALYEQRYANEPFVDVLPAGSHPQTRSVRGANMCRIAVHQATGSNTIVVLSVIDNLVKGAAGQAIQNMNLMFGVEESTGLNLVGLQP